MAHFSHRALEGYYLIDHRESPGTLELPGPNTIDRPLVAAGMMLEAPVVRCSQCHALVRLDPRRQRERHWCTKCGEYHCDGCDARQPYGHCETLDAVFDRLQKENELLIQKGSD